ncbi:MAG: cyclopropane fatty acyl phospholipid synthase [Candidatus Andersenbacteria bacterium]
MATLKARAEQLVSLADIKINGSRPWDLQVHNEALYARIFRQGSLGLGEAYMDGWWDAPQLDQFFYKVFRAKLEDKVQPATMVLPLLKSFLVNQQNRTTSRVSVEHYNLGNDFYAKMLDRRMAYTCAYFGQTESQGEPLPGRTSKTLDQAQEDKLELVCKKIGLKRGEKVLDLGCGWGTFAKYAAEKYGAHVVGYNISTEQVAYAKQTTQGLPVEIKLQDYRDATGTYDKVVSIGLAEHIGYKNYRGFFEVINRTLKNDGLALVHTIGNRRSVTGTDPWLATYIFPNSMLPSIKQLGKAMEGLFIMEDWHNFGADYDLTLMAWFKNFDRNWPSSKGTQPHFNDRFYRMWKFYLLSCAALFRARKTQLWQIVLSKNGVLGGYQSVR